jgi:FkbM family methyltransferase
MLSTPLTAPRTPTLARPIHSGRRSRVFDRVGGRPATTIYDVGMNDGEDTAHYLETGHRVVAVEANPDLAAEARERFAREIGEGRLVVVDAAISRGGRPVKLLLAGADLGASSTNPESIAHRKTFGSVEVRGVTLDSLFEEHGVPHYLKVDIQGSDRLCILALTRARRPRYVSFEVGSDAHELIGHAAEVGYTRFKVIHQNTFRELENQECLTDRIKYRLMREMGFDRPTRIRRAGRFFVAGHSSGPLPWRTDGRWRDAEETIRRLDDARRAGRLRGWYDVHAAVG